MSFNKKIISITLGIALLIAAAYTGYWFYLKSCIEKRVADYVISYTAQDQGLENIHYNLDFGGFPFMVVEISNIKLESRPEEKINGERITLTILGRNSLKINKNPFFHKLAWHLKDVAIDFQLEISSEEHPVFNGLILASEVDFDSRPNKIDYKISGLSAQISGRDSNLEEVLGVDSLTNLTKFDKDSKYVESTISLSGVRTKNRGEIIKHSLLKMRLTDINFENFEKLSTKIAEENLTREELITEFLEALYADSTINIDEYKITTDYMQGILTGKIFFSKDKDISADLLLKIKNSKPHPLLDQMPKDENGNVILKIKYENNELLVNDSKIMIQNKQPQE